MILLKTDNENGYIKRKAMTPIVVYKSHCFIVKFEFIRNKYIDLYKKYTYYYD